MNQQINKPFTHSRNFYYLLLFMWFLLNLFQAYFTELLHDEAYYFYYSRQLAWGYYDHPPMIALLIKWGYSLFHNSLGVRLFIALLYTLSIAILVELARLKNYLLFFAVLFSIFIFQVFGFIAIPDSPMLFFTVLFFYMYRRYLESNSWFDAFLLALVTAGLLYSKYLGVLVLFFTFISNLKLVKRKTFWFTFLLAVLLMLPHLFWQIRHDYISLYFHLAERNRDAAFNVINIVNYLLGQIGIFNPLIAVILFYYAFKKQVTNDFSKSFKYNLIGILSVGFILSFLGNVEANWTAAACIPLILLAYPEIENKLNLHRTLYILSSISLVLILFLRSYLVYNFMPGINELALQGEFHGWDVWTQKINKLAQNRPVVFMNSYQRASKYIYYTGGEAFSFNYMLYRKNQFDLRKTEAELQGKKVLFMNNDKTIKITGMDLFPIPGADSTVIMGEKWFYKNIDHYHSYNFLPIKIYLASDEFRPGILTDIPIQILNPLDSSFVIRPNGGPIKLSVTFSHHGRVVKYYESEDITGLWLDRSYTTTLLARTPETPGNYELRVAIRSGWFPPGLNSRIYKIKVTDQ